MKWIIFTGSWRLTNNKVEADVRAAAREVFARGDAVVTGGATGVDYFLMDEWLKIDPKCTRIQVVVTAPLSHYIPDYRKNWTIPPRTQKDVDELERVLNTIKERNPAALIEMPHHGGDITQDDYNLHHDEEVKIADEVYAFQVNNSAGTQDTIDKAIAAGLPVTLHKTYTIAE